MRAGDRILDYLVDRELGEGGMAKVYLARHTVLNQWVAIKVLDPEVARKPGIKERFIQEANIQASMRHPGIVQVLTATQIEDGVPALIMEYVSGQSLADVLETRSTLQIEECITLMEQVVAAVGHAHREGVIHRDLKPSNVMVMATGEAKVTDFGIAKVMGSTKLTRTGTAMGSAHYMSPEQIRRPESVDARSDIYSLGCMFYEVLTGHPPFGDHADSGTESDFEIKTAHVSTVAPAPSTLNPEVPPWLDNLVMTMLAKEPTQRPPNCEQILKRITQKSNPAAAKRKDKTVLITGPATAQGSETSVFTPPVKSTPSRTGIPTEILVMAGVFAVVAVAFFFPAKKESVPMEPSPQSQTAASSRQEKTPSVAPETNVTAEIGTLDGDWYSKKWAYGYTLDKGRGYATITNSPNFEVGQEIVTLSAIGNNQFVGKNVYKDGRFYKVTVTLRPDGSLYFEGEKNVQWTMQRINKTQLEQIKQSLNAPAQLQPSYEEPVKTAVSEISRLDGEWYSKKWMYGYTLRDGKGYATITNSPNFEVGQEIVWLKPIGDNQFVGKNVYKDGRFYSVKVTLRRDGSLFFEGEKNVSWTMERITRYELDQMRRQLNASSGSS